MSESVVIRHGQYVISQTWPDGADQPPLFTCWGPRKSDRSANPLGTYATLKWAQHTCQANAEAHLCDQLEHYLRQDITRQAAWDQTAWERVEGLGGESTTTAAAKERRRWVKDLLQCVDSAHTDQPITPISQRLTAAYNATAQHHATDQELLATIAATRRKHAHFPRTQP